MIDFGLIKALGASGALFVAVSIIFTYVKDKYFTEKKERADAISREAKDRQMAIDREAADRVRMQNQIDKQSEIIEQMHKEQLAFRDTIIEELFAHNIKVIDVLKETNTQMQRHAELINTIYSHASAKFDMK